MPANDYITADDIKLAMPDGNWDFTYDLELERLATAASRVIDRACSREDGFFKVTTPSTRYYTGNGAERLYIDSFTSITELATDDAWSGTYLPWTATDYFLYPYDASVLGYPYEAIEVNRLGTNRLWYFPQFPRSVKITALFGWGEEPPAPIVQACIIQAVRWWKRQQQAYSDVSAVLELGQVVFTKKCDPDVELIVNNSPYARPLAYL